MRRVAGARILRAVIASGLLGAMACREQAPVPEGTAPGERVATARWPAERHDEGYVGPASCAECHPRNHATWQASYHRTMTQAASPAAIAAPFESREGNAVQVGALDGAAWELERAGDEFFATPVSLPGDPGGERHGERMRVALTTGSHHYQIYWLASEQLGGLLALPFVWHLSDQAWLPRRALFLNPPSFETAYEIDRWQAVCIQCHTTNGTPEPAASPGPSVIGPIGPIGPRVAEFGISCEACHGPAGEHVERERALAAAPGSPSHASEEPESHAIVDPASLSHERSAMVCGQCHAVHPFRSSEERADWRKNGFAYRPGDDLAQTRELLRLLPSAPSERANSAELTEVFAGHPELFDELFWSDGEVRVSGREYNGLVESPCFQRGELTCLSCHAMHPATSDSRPLSEWANDQLAPGMDGSMACLQCHPFGAQEIGGAQEVRAHTHHAPASSGSDCLNCHMPHTTYGLTKAIRSHTITSPSVAATLATGRPNACNLCHLDRPLGWTADHLAAWYGHARPVLETEREEVSAVVIDALAGDAGQRALAAWALGWEPARAVSGTGWMPYVLSTLMLDAYDAVARVALVTTRLDPRYRDLTLDFTVGWGPRGDPVRAGILRDWQREGLVAAPHQRTAVLVTPDGRLDPARFERLFGLRDERDVRLAE